MGSQSTAAIRKEIESMNFIIPPHKFSPLLVGLLATAPLYAGPLNTNPSPSPTSATTAASSAWSSQSKLSFRVEGLTKENRGKVRRAMKEAGAEKVKIKMKTRELQIYGKSLNEGKVLEVVRREVPSVQLRKI